MEQTGDTTLASPPQCIVIFYEPPGLLILGVAATAGLLCIFIVLRISAMVGFHCSAWLMSKGRQGYILACYACHWSQFPGSDRLRAIAVTLSIGHNLAFERTPGWVNNLYAQYTFFLSAYSWGTTIHSWDNLTLSPCSDLCLLLPGLFSSSLAQCLTCYYSFLWELWFYINLSTCTLSSLDRILCLISHPLVSSFFYPSPLLPSLSSVDTENWTQGSVGGKYSHARRQIFHHRTTSLPISPLLDCFKTFWT